MSFFTSGFSGIINRRAAKMAKKSSKKGISSDGESEEKRKDSKGHKADGQWAMFRDAYGRPYWQNAVTGEWTFAEVSPGVATAVFSPSPVVAQFHTNVWGQVVPVSPTPFPVPVVEVKEVKEGAKRSTKPAEERKKEDGVAKKNKEKGGWWETRYDKDGYRYWEHTVTKKTRRTDPYY